MCPARPPARPSVCLCIPADRSLARSLPGSTKLYRRRSPHHITSQRLTATLHPSSALLLLPDPLQPFEDSHYTQHQTVHVPADDSASFVVLDWLTEGRSARGEHWALHRLESRNEVFAGGRLLLRDALVLDAELVGGETLRGRMDGVACVATVIVRGPRFAGLVRYVLDRYLREPRVGARGFGGATEKRWEVLWTAASVRGCLVVKVSGGELQEVRGFLRELLEERKEGGVGEGEGGGEGGGDINTKETDGETDTNTSDGDIVREFGEDSLRCLR